MKFLDFDHAGNHFFLTIVLCAFLLGVFYTITSIQQEKERFLILRSYNVVSIPDHLAQLENYKWQALMEDAKLEYEEKEIEK